MKEIEILFIKKNYKFKTMPIIFYDIKKDFNYKPL